MGGCKPFLPTFLRLRHAAGGDRERAECHGDAGNFVAEGVHCTNLLGTELSS